MQTYLFYDIETTGLNKSFDQVLQFAAIRTDLSLNELERHELKIKLNPDTIPSPKAIITHHIGIDESLQGENELDAIRQIHEWMNTPGTISVGYNTLGFDDEFLRFSFYRNLLTPYTHQYANQCSRMDLYPIAVMYFLFHHEIITWPLRNGKSTLKLEFINQANHFIEGRSHHAMVDVEVTLALARAFIKNREIWDYAVAFFNKNTDKTRTQQLPIALKSALGIHHEGLMLDGIFGGTHAYQAPVLNLGDHQVFSNQSLWLRLDTEKLSESTLDTLIENTWVSRKKWGEPGFILPIKDRFRKHLSLERQTLVETNKQWLNDHPELLEKIIRHHRTYLYPVYPETDVSACLYQNGFWNDADVSQCRKFHQLNVNEKSRFIDSIINKNIKALAVRLLGRHYPETLSPAQQEEFQRFLSAIHQPAERSLVLDFKGEQHLSPPQALAEIAILRQSAETTPLQHQLLNGLEAYLNEKAAIYHSTT